MKKLIVLGGPTASGKTTQAIAWAKQYNTVILSADSRQCYRELNIGVAKPNTHELEQVPHYFINSHSMHEQVSAADYEQFGLAFLQQQFQKTDCVICVGGTGLYIKALCEGLDPMPPINSSIKTEVEARYQEKGLIWLQHEVEQHDPSFFAQGEIHNPARLLRALIFVMSTGKSIQTYRSGQKKARDFDIDYFYLAPERSTLYERINQRVDHMMDAGLLEEVQSLIPYQHLKNLQTVGYQELFAYFNGSLSLPEAIERIKQNTRHYAKRQLTWFRNQGQFTKIIN